MRIVITGSIAYDYLMSFPGKFRDHLLTDQIHNVSLSFLVDSLRRQRGGVAANIAYTIALLGGRPKIMAAAGRDFTEYGVWLEAQGIDTTGIVVFENDYCASFFVNTDLEQNQIASFYTGAMANANQLSFKLNAADVELAVISPNDPEAMCAYITECKFLGVPYIYDPSQQIIRLTAEQLADGIKGCRLLTVNEYELFLIKEKTGYSDVEILDLVGGLVLTKGKSGSVIFVDGESYEIPAIPPRHLAEPTGAGDAFRAGLLRGIQLGASWPVAGRMGALAAAYVLEHYGTQGHTFSTTEFAQRYRQVFDDDILISLLSQMKEETS